MKVFGVILIPLLLVSTAVADEQNEQCLCSQKYPAPLVLPEHCESAEQNEFNLNWKQEPLCEADDAYSAEADSEETASLDDDILFKGTPLVGVAAGAHAALREFSN